MSELFLGIIALAFVWAVTYDLLIDSFKGLQSACHEIKEQRIKHKQRMAELKNELNDIERRMKEK